MSKKLLANIVVALIFVLFLNKNALASEKMAFDLIESVSQTTLSIVSNKNLSVSDKEKELIELFENSVDTKWISKFVLGRSSRGLSEDQQDRYTKLYHKFLLQSYVPKFQTYTDEKIIIISSTVEFEGEYLVQTEIQSTTDPVFRVNYKVHKDNNSKYKIFDIVAEGISMITTQRSEFSSIVSRKGIDFLIEKLEQKTAKN